MAALQAEHFITAHASDAAAAATPAGVATHANGNGALANGAPAPVAAPAPAPAADGKAAARPPGAGLSPAEKAAVDKEADDTPMMAVL
jgi:hypothetical protein